MGGKTPKKEGKLALTERGARAPRPHAVWPAARQGCPLISQQRGFARRRARRGEGRARARRSQRTRLREERVEGVVLDGRALGLLAVCAKGEKAKEKDVSGGGAARRVSAATRASRTRALGQRLRALSPPPVADAPRAVRARATAPMRGQYLQLTRLDAVLCGGRGGCEKRAAKAGSGAARFPPNSCRRSPRARGHSPRQNSSQHALPIWTPACPRWTRMISRICGEEGTGGVRHNALGPTARFVFRHEVAPTGRTPRVYAL